jgi:hypothetical protein
MNIMQLIIFSGAATHAKSDLKRELASQSVRPAIVEYILSKMGSNTETSDVDVYPDNVTEPTEEDYMSGGTQNEEIPRPIENVIRPPSSAESEVGIIHVRKILHLTSLIIHISTIIISRSYRSIVQEN